MSVQAADRPVLASWPSTVVRALEMCWDRLDGKRRLSYYDVEFLSHVIEDAADDIASVRSAIADARNNRVPIR